MLLKYSEMKKNKFRLNAVIDEILSHNLSKK